LQIEDIIVKIIQKENHLKKNRKNYSQNNTPQRKNLDKRNLHSGSNPKKVRKNKLFPNSTAVNERKQLYHYLTFFPKCDQNSYICEKTLSNYVYINVKLRTATLFYSRRKKPASIRPTRYYRHPEYFSTACP
jgi:hypothetical protein